LEPYSIFYFFLLGRLKFSGRAHPKKIRPGRIAAPGPFLTDWN